MCWVAAPAARMALTAAWTLVAHCWTLRSWGSFIRPKMTLALDLYLAASWLQIEANWGGR